MVSNANQFSDPGYRPKGSIVAQAVITKVPQTGLGGVNDGNLFFSQCWKLGSPGSKGWQGWILLSLA